MQQRDTANTLRHKLEKLSIRARIGYGIQCLRLLASHHQLKNSWISDTIDLLAEFTSVEWFHVWEEEVRRRLGPIMDHFPDATGDTLIDAVPPNLLQALLLIEDAATANLYGALSESAPESIEPLLNLAGVLRDTGLTPPDVSRFECSPFSEAEGWGNPRALSSFE